MTGKAILKRDIVHPVEIQLSGSDIAELFWDLNAEEQALFFNRLGQEDLLSCQLQSVTDSKLLAKEGRWVMERIGQYGPEDQSNEH